MCYMRLGSLLQCVRTGSSKKFWLTRDWSLGFHKVGSIFTIQSKRTTFQDRLEPMELEIYDDTEKAPHLWGWMYITCKRYLPSVAYGNPDFVFLFIPRGARYEKQMAASSRVSPFLLPEFQQNKERRRISLNLISYFPFCMPEYYICSRKKIFLSFILLTINEELLMYSLT
jgi:hypothetical protein